MPSKAGVTGGSHENRWHLIAKVLSDGKLDMRYHYLNRDGDLMVGKCLSPPEITEDGVSN